MPRGHGRTVFTPDNDAHRRSSALSRRFSEQCTRKLPSKENLVILPVLRNCGERRIVFGVRTLDALLSSMPVPSTSFISAFNVGESHRLTGNNSRKNLKESSSFNYGSDYIASNASIDEACKVDKPVKQGSKKKGKKKQKQYKRSTHKKASFKPDDQDEEEANCDTSKSETSTSGDIVCSAASENNLSSVVNNPEVDMTEDSLDDCGTECSIANDGGFNPLENRMNLISRNVSVQDTDFSSERLLGSSQASSSDDFHPVIRNKRGRPARKFLGCSNEVHRLNNNAHLHRFSEVNNKHPPWQKVEKASASESRRPRNIESFTPQNVDISLSCMGTKVRQLGEVKQSRLGKSLSIVSSVVKTNLGHISMDGSSYLEKLKRKPKVILIEEAQNQNFPACSSAIESNSDQSHVDMINDPCICENKEDIQCERVDMKSLVCLSSREILCPSPEEGELINKLDSQPCASSEESSDSPSSKGRSFPLYVNDLTKIIEAVDRSYKLMVAAEGFKLATRSLLTGFERVLLSASPLIEVSNMKLRRLWQWYEKPGSYGLEVELDDLYSSKRSRTNLSKVCAYFAPYLSAVQLFGRSGKSIYHPINDTRSTEPSLSGESEEFNKPIYREQLGDELLFEYFDSDQPQQRRPLFEKIQELILGDSSSNCHFFGDPSKLGCLNLKELHPASWYAVAWYPIYRIPDGSFRAAFLTYHSFRRFVRRSTSNCSGGGCINSLILTVVGLQSYNAQGEFWFEPKDSAMLNFPSENLKDRLESLERAADVMSRATIRKGNLNCTNRHPDYEFFLSRKR